MDKYSDELSQDISLLKGVGLKTKSLLCEVGIDSLFDLLSTIPIDLINKEETSKHNFEDGNYIVVSGEIIKTVKEVLKKSSVKVELNTNIQSIEIDDNHKIVNLKSDKQSFMCSKLVLTHGARLPKIKSNKKEYSPVEKFHPRPAVHLLVEDNINTCIKIFEDNLMMNDVINIGGAKEYKILDVAKLIIEKLDSKSKIIHLPALKEGDMTRRMPDNSKMLSIIQNDLISLDHGLDLMLEHPDFRY